MEYNLTAILLSTRESGSSDRIAVFFSKERGKIHVFCPRSRHKSGKGGYLEPFAVLDLQTNIQSGLYRLIEAGRLERFPKLYEDWERMAYGLIVTEAVEHLWPEEEQQPEVYDFLLTFFQALEHRSPRITAGAALWQILDFAGFRVDFTSCVGCGERISEGKMSIEDGGLIGSCCGEFLENEKVPPSAVEALVKIQNYQWYSEWATDKIRGKDLVIAERILLEYLNYYLERPLKSVSFLEKMKK